MGRVKLDIKKIQNPTNRQVTFSKRKNGLKKKADELSVLCDIDIALLMFSPSGKLTQFCRDDKIEEVIIRFGELPQHERAKRRAENIEFVNKLVQKLSTEPGLEAPRVGGADRQHEVQELRILLRQAESERDFFAAKTRLFAGNEYITNFADPAQLFDIRSELLQAKEKVEKRLALLRPVVIQNAVEQTSFDMLSDISAQDSTEGLDSTRDSAQAIHMHSWDRVSNLDNGTSIVANSQMREASGADYEGNGPFYPSRSNVGQYHERVLDGRAGPLGQSGNFNNFHGTDREMRAGRGGQITEIRPYGTIVEENNSQFAYRSGVQPQISSLPNQGRQLQLHNGDSDYPLYDASLRHPQQHSSSSWNPH